MNDAIADHVKHLRTIHFSLILCCVVLAIATPVDYSANTKAANEELKKIVLACSKDIWQDDFLPRSLGGSWGIPQNLREFAGLWQRLGEEFNGREGFSRKYNLNLRDEDFDIAFPNLSEFMNPIDYQNVGLLALNYTYEVMSLAPDDGATVVPGEDRVISFSNSDGATLVTTVVPDDGTISFSNSVATTLQPFTWTAVVRNNGGTTLEASANFANMTVTVDPSYSSSIHFPIVDPSKSAMATKSFSELSTIFEKRIKRSESPIELFGAKFSTELILRFAPAIVLFVQFYLMVHMRSFPSKRKDSSGLPPWIGVYKDSFARILTLVTLALLPVVTVIYLATRTTGIYSTNVRIVLIAIFSVASCWLAYVTVIAWQKLWS